MARGFSEGLSSVLSIDNHDIISLKLYQLTVIRSEKEEEEEEEEEITIPSVDNFELLRRKTNAHLQPLRRVTLLTSCVVFSGSS